MNVHRTRRSPERPSAVSPLVRARSGRPLRTAAARAPTSRRRPGRSLPGSTAASTTPPSGRSSRRSRSYLLGDEPDAGPMTGSAMAQPQERTFVSLASPSPARRRSKRAWRQVTWPASAPGAAVRAHQHGSGSVMRDEVCASDERRRSPSRRAGGSLPLRSLGPDQRQSRLLKERN